MERQKITMRCSFFYSSSFLVEVNRLSFISTAVAASSNSTDDNELRPCRHPFLKNKVEVVVVVALVALVVAVFFFTILHGYTQLVQFRCITFFVLQGL